LVAWRVFEHAFGRAPEQPEQVIEMPQTAEEVEAMGWREMEVLAARLIEDVQLPSRPRLARRQKRLCQHSGPG
jgi:hypothetical protein